MPPRKSSPPHGSLLDAWGRANRKLKDALCVHCGEVFRPRSARSRYCSRPCAWANNGRNNPLAGKGLGWVNGRGYRELRVNGAVVKEHRLFAEQKIGRPLFPDEDVHHLNGDKADNRPENIDIMSHGEHSTHHNYERVHKRGYRLNLSDNERAARAARMRQKHADGRLMTPQARAALAKARGEQEAGK